MTLKAGFGLPGNCDTTEDTNAYRSARTGTFRVNFGLSTMS